MWEYRATVLRVVDGDTVDVYIDLGFHLTLRQRVRLAGIDAPECNAAGPEGEMAADFLAGLLPAGTAVVLQTAKPKDKYGRFLAHVLLPHGDSTLNVNDRMIEAGHAVPYTGGTR